MFVLFLVESQGEWELKEIQTEELGAPKRVREKLRRVVEGLQKEKDAEVKQLREKEAEVAQLREKEAEVKQLRQENTAANDKIKSLENQMKKQSLQTQKVAVKKRVAHEATKEPSLYFEFLKCCK